MSRWLEKIRQRRQENSDKSRQAERAEKQAKEESERQRKKRDVEKRYYDETVVKMLEEKDNKKDS